MSPFPEETSEARLPGLPEGGKTGHSSAIAKGMSIASRHSRLTRVRPTVTLRGPLSLAQADRNYRLVMFGDPSLGDQKAKVEPVTADAPGEAPGGRPSLPADPNNI
jgi:hypothetical protein